MRRLLLFVFSHRTLAVLRWDCHFIQVRLANFLLRRRRKLLRRIDLAGTPLYLNLGSGPRGVSHRDWINVDGYADLNVDYLMDFRRKWPLPDSSIDGIFCEHVFEHFDSDDGEFLLRECWRTLRAGGSIRIIVPDGAKIMKTYFEEPAQFPSWRVSESSCPMEAVNSYFRQRYEHQYTYDSQLLKHQIQKAGFTQVSESSFGQGTVSSKILLDDEKYVAESLYIEAAKPTE